MEVSFNIPDDKIKSFTHSAKNRLNDQCQTYCLEIIKEAEKFEKITREDNVSAEITENNIVQAVRLYRTTRKKSKFKIFISIISEILLVVTGLMYFPEKFVVNNSLNIGYLIVFLLITFFALLTTILVHFWEVK